MGLCALRRGDPDSGEHGDEPDHQVGGDGLSDELGCEETSGNGIDRHRIGNPGRACALQRHHPEDERECAAADAEIKAGNPLRCAEGRQCRDATCHPSNQNERYGGRYLSRGGAVEVLEGEWKPNRLVLIEWESPEAAKRWYESEEYEAIADVRRRCAATELVLVEGL